MLVYGKHESLVIMMEYVVSYVHQVAVLNDLSFVNAAGECKKRPYGRDIL